MDIDAILKCLPHRYPFLMIDKIIEVDGDNSAIGIKNVSVNEPIFQGHFPGNPVFPGVLIIEGMAQTAGAIAIAADKTEGQHIVYMVTVDKCKFRRPARPGDVIEYHIR
jgi:3-hydroxyacyl-[acyl-carrier-protein] dehydratase